jgi:hypothetical protein
VADKTSGRQRRAAVGAAPIIVPPEKAWEGEFGCVGRCGPGSVGLAQRTVPLINFQIDLN